MTTEPEPRRLVYTVAQLAAFLGRAENTIRREIKAGRLRARMQRSEMVVVESDLLAYLDSLPVVEIEGAAPVVAPVALPTTSTARRRVTRLLELYPSEAAQ